MTDEMRAVLDLILAEFERTGSYPLMQRFRLEHEAERRLIDSMVGQRFLESLSSRYVPTLRGLQEAQTRSARAALEVAARLLPLLQDAYRSDPTATIEATRLAAQLQVSEAQVQRALTMLHVVDLWHQQRVDDKTGLIAGVVPSEAVLDARAIDLGLTFPAGLVERAPGDAEDHLIRWVEIDGYGPFLKFSAAFGPLTVIAGANASGKSSLFAFFRFLATAVQEPPPPEIDAAVPGRQVLHIGVQHMAFSVGIDLGFRDLLRYEVSLRGPQGRPTVATERLSVGGLNGEEPFDAFSLLEFSGGQGVVRSPTRLHGARVDWTVQPNELALRRVLDPNLATVARAQSALASIRVFSGFDVSPTADLRKPAYVEEMPQLDPRGGNLSAVLLSIQHETPDAWAELESQIRSVVPGFRSLTVKPFGARGTVIGMWREQGVDGDLTLADLSDGTLRLICWATLCLSPRVARLVCVDEPETGLHPRVLPVLAGMFRMLAARTQVIVATHSPVLLSQFPLEDIAVMRKEDGVSRYVRPASSEALRSEVEEFGGDAIARLHASDELEILP